MSSVELKFADLERRMKSLAAEDGDIYTPNIFPTAPVCYVFVCMEPSLTGSNGDKAKRRLAEGGRNFLWSMDDFILHHSIQHYLLKPGQWHHVTDVSKGAMTVNKAQAERRLRYRRWYDLLLEELIKFPLHVLNRYLPATLETWFGRKHVRELVLVLLVEFM